MAAETSDRPYVADGDVPRRRGRFVVVAVVLVAVVVGLGGLVADRRQGALSSAPTPTVVDDVSMFVYPEALPADGGQLNVVFRNEASTQFVLPHIADLDQATADGQWERVGSVGLCPFARPCVGGLVDPDASTTAMAVLAPADGVSPLQRVILHEAPGRYRLVARGPQSGPGAEFTIGAAGAASSAPDIDADSLYLRVTPVLVTADEPTEVIAALSGAGDFGSCAETSVDGWTLNRWDGAAWQSQPVEATWPEPASRSCEATVQLPALAPGAWRLVATGAEGELQGPFWVE